MRRSPRLFPRRRVGRATDAATRVSQSRGFDSETNDRDDYDPAEDGPLGYAVDGPFDSDSVRPNRLIDTTGPGTSTLFVAPGAPRGYFVGLRYEFAEGKR